MLLCLLTYLRSMRNQAYDGDWPPESYNALFMVRLFTKYFVDNLSQPQIHDQYESDRKFPDVVPPPARRPSVSPTNPLTTVQLGDKKVLIDPHVVLDKRLHAEQLLEELFQLLIYGMTETPSNYEFYVEALNLLIVMFSTQLGRTAADASQGNYFLDITLGRLSHFARGVVGRLVANSIEQQPPPPAAGGVLYSAYSYLFSAKKSDGPRSRGNSPLADKSMLLILVLSNQSPPNFTNMFRDAVGGLQDTQVATDQGPDILENRENLNISFRKLYQMFCGTLEVEENSLLVYLLMQQNRSFKAYVLSRTDPDSLDDVYMESIQKIMIPPQPWYTQAIIKSGLSLSGLTILVLIRTIQANLSQHKDIYFHTNCLAILANMSSKISGMHSVVAQKIVGLFETVSKRYLKLQQRASNDNLPLTPMPADVKKLFFPVSPNHENLNLSIVQIDPADRDCDLIIYSDLVSLLLEFKNSILTHTLKNNAQLIYALMHKKEMFGMFRMHPQFGDLIENIDTVNTYFHTKLVESDLKMPSAADVLKVIEQASKTWPPGKLKVFAELKFQYEEEKEYSLFFLPYVWSLVYRHGLIYWDEDKVKLIDEIDPDFPVDDFTVPL
ncbi:hypothetical protein HK104_005566 [Borealophlyctis nickersoniae]|nr:hypothetical protein HK104_005566 [Borealophlyctis nickersoniae]